MARTDLMCAQNLLLPDLRAMSVRLAMDMGLQLIGVLDLVDGMLRIG